MSRPATLAYFDCFSGASGDMLIGALLDAGLSLEALRAELTRLGLPGYTVAAERRQQHAIAGTKFNVVVSQDEHPHRHLSDIEALLKGSSLPPADVERSLAIFRRLGRAEAKVHATTIEEVHFHEVGAIDSIVDIVGCVIGLRLLGISQVSASPLPLGSGFVRSAHGTLPVPAPATVEILAEAGAPTLPLDSQAELVTPTGAAILCELARFGQPAMRLSSVGYGFGTRELPWVNAVRVWLGEPGAEESRLDQDVVVELACNLDDMRGEELGYVLERVMDAGALDAWFTPIQMKKDRPAVMLSVLARPEDGSRLRRLLLAQTSTLGVRYVTWAREMAGRASVEVETPWGVARAKLKLLDDRVVAVAPEYEDCARLARHAGVPLARVYEAVIAGYRQG